MCRLSPLVAGAVIAALAGCSAMPSPPQSGEVVGRRYTPARVWTSTSCSTWRRVKYRSGSKVRTKSVCAARHIDHHSAMAMYYLRLRDGTGRVGDRLVDLVAWSNCPGPPRRSIFPACATGAGEQW